MGSANYNFDLSPDQNLSRYLQRIRTYPMLEVEEERQLAKRWRDHEDPEAAERMVTSHLRLVAKIANTRPGQGRVEGLIGRSPANRKKMAVVNKGGKPSLTRYRVLAPVGTAASLVECRLATGRTHQIRVHMASLGHPIVGDSVYGGGARRRLKNAAETVRLKISNFSHQALHAFLIGFTHPSSGAIIQFKSELPNDFNELIDNLEKL